MRGSEFYLRAFYELSSERLIPRGPIPWNRIREYGTAQGLEPDVLALFHAVVREMDQEYCKARAELDAEG